MSSLKKDTRMTSIRTLRYVALLEATSFLALLAATFIKYANDSPAGVQVLGPVHGALFVAYVLIALSVRAPAGWSNRATVWVLLGAVLPFGGFVTDRWLVRSAPSKLVPRR